MKVKPDTDYSTIEYTGLMFPFTGKKTDLILTVTEKQNHHNMPAELCTKLMGDIATALLSCSHHWVRTSQQQVIQLKKAKRQEAFLYLRNTVWHWGKM